METTTKSFRWLIDDKCDKGQAWLSFIAPDKKVVQDFILGLAGKSYDIVIKPHREKRSLDANGYFWSLVNELANVMRMNKDECYLLMLKRYGQRQVVKVITEGLPILLRAIKYYEEMKEEGNCTYVKVFTGSSEYDTREMSILLDGIISECKEQGIETMTPSEIEKLKESWKGEK